MSSYILKIKGKRPNRFLEFLIHLHINFIQRKQTKDYIIIEVLDEDYDKIKKIKTSYEITIVKRKGIAYILYLIKTKTIFLLSIGFAMIVLLTLTRMTFSIQVIETDASMRELIIEDLEEFGIQKYRFKVSYQKKEKIRDQILEKEKDVLEWLEIEEIGTTYQIKLIKRVKKEEEKEIEARHIVAKKKGMIVNIVAESGEVVAKKNQYVDVGDVLISGLIMNKEEIVSKVAAKGKVYAEVWYQVRMNLPLLYEEESLTGKSRQVFEFHFLTKDIRLNEFIPYQHAREKEKILWQHPLLPFRFSYTKKEQLNIKRTEYDQNHLEESAIPLAISKLKDKLGSDIEIISQKVLKKEQNAGKINIELFFKVKEDITSYQSIVDVNIEEAKKQQEE